MERRNIITEEQQRLVDRTESKRGEGANDAQHIRQNRHYKAWWKHVNKETPIRVRDYST